MSQRRNKAVAASQKSSSDDLCDLDTDERFNLNDQSSPHPKSPS